MEYRMYCLVLRQLSPIQKGVQSAHACMEYASKYKHSDDFNQYVAIDKTLIMLDGGISQELERIKETLISNDIDFASFNEPDINDCITCVCFLANEQVYDRSLYQSYKQYSDCNYEDFSNETELYNSWVEYIGGAKNATLISIINGKKLSM